MTRLRRLTDRDLAQLLAEPRYVLFKHSTRCVASDWALRHVEGFAVATPDAPVGYVDVVADPMLSAAVATATDVPHASPQVLLLVDGHVAWHASHGEIRERALRRAWAEILA